MEEMKAAPLRNPPNNHLLSSSNTTTTTAAVTAAYTIASRLLSLSPTLGEVTLYVKESAGLKFTSCRVELCSGPAKQDSTRRDVHSHTRGIETGDRCWSVKEGQPLSMKLHGMEGRKV